MSIRLFKSLLFLTACGMAAGGISGCGGGGLGEPERVVVYGDVTWKGNPIQEGTIRFISDAGPSAQGPIQNGSYRIEHKGGVPVGNCRVEIQAYEEQDIKEPGSTLIEMPSKVGVQFLPQQFNSQSTLLVEVASGKQNEHDFHLEAR
jgi:hypothetical protein